MKTQPKTCGKTFERGMADCKQGGLDVVEFYNKLVGLWSKLNNHVKIPYCTCKGCQCGVSSMIARMFDEEKSYQFLMGLSDEIYGQIRS